MNYEEFRYLLMRELDRIFAEKPRGTMARIQRELGVNKHYFRQWRSGKTIPMERLLEVLMLLEVEPARFFASALVMKIDEGEGLEESKMGPLGQLLMEKFGDEIRRS